MELPQNQVVRAITKKSVLIALGALIAVLIAWDIVLATDDTEGNTWSELIRIAANATVAVPWLLGLVMGHWFHPGETREPAIDPPGNALVLLIATAIIAIIGLFIDLPLWLPLVTAAVVGAYLWPVETNPEAVSQVVEVVS